MFDSLEELVVATAGAVRSPERLSVSQAAQKYVRINNPGTYVGNFNPDFAPYLNEIMDTLTSLDYTGLVFAGPARTGKSQLLFNWLTHTAICDPADMMVVNMTMAVARDWSNGDLRRFILNNPELKKRMVPGKKADNTYDKQFLSGMRLLVKWPSITELSGKTIPRMWCNDYDRVIPQDIDGQGNLFDLARKRTTTYKRFGMTVAEGSPGFPIKDPKWIAQSPHEAPPCEPSGILGLYNRGDRRRRYWRCQECGGSFEPSFQLFRWPDSKDKMEAAEQVVLVCPHCGHYMEQSQRRELDMAGKWLKEGEVWLETGEVVGTPRRSDIASFWLKGPPAVFQDWKSMVLNYLNASEEYERTGDEGSLTSTTNTDQGEAYLPKALQNGRLPEELMARAQDWGGTRDAPVVPHGVRFLIATIDVQKQAFVVQVHGIGVGGDVWIVDMFKVQLSERKDRDGKPLPIRPDAYPEDWQVLVKEVIERTYEVGDGTGRRMMVKAVSCDMSGEAGVSVNAVNFWRWLRDTHGSAHHNRFQLVKGEPTPSAPLIRIGYPEATKKDRHSSLRGDVPVLFINSTKAKDKIAGMLGRVDPSTGEIALVGGQVNFPIWAEKWFYQQLTAETRGPVRWENPNKKRNEAFDLLTYAYATCMNTRQVSPTIDHLRWQDPPTWAKEWDDNVMVFDPNKEDEAPVYSKKKPKYDLKSLAEESS